MAGLIKRAWNHRATGYAAAGILALVFLVLIAGIVLSIVAPVKPGSQGPQQSGAAPVQTTAPAAADDGACHVAAGDVSARPKLPADLRWAAAQGLTWPVSDSVGPTKTRDGFPVCFARSPLGAALMGTGFLNSLWQGQSPREVVEHYVAETPGKKVLLAKSTGAGDPNKIASEGVTPAGFIVDSFTPDLAQVTIVVTAPGTKSGFAGYPMTFSWIDGDWRIKVLDNGDTQTGDLLTSPVKGQFVEWRK